MNIINTSDEYYYVDSEDFSNSTTNSEELSNKIIIFWVVFSIFILCMLLICKKVC